MTRFALASVAVAAALAVTVSAQTTTPVHPGAGGSPHVRTAWTIDGASISIEYGRPFLKGRAIGKDLAPFGQVWRTGADEATTLKTDKQTGQAGTTYDQQQDAGRVPMTVGQAKAPVEQLTFSIDDTPKGATLRIEWGTTSVTTPFTVS